MKSTVKNVTFFLSIILLGAVSMNAWAQDQSSAPVVVSAQSEKIPSSGNGFDLEGKFSLGVNATGFYEISNYESIYVNFSTSGIRASGFGFNTLVEYGFTNHITGAVNLGYSRLTYANKFSTATKKNFFIPDIMMHYYFMTDQKIMPYLSFGAGALVSSAGIAPTGNVGGGVRYQVSDEFSVRFGLLYKTAIIHHRGEASLGVAYHF